MMMKVLIQLFIVSQVFLVFKVAHAHDIWLVPDQFTLSKGDILTVHQTVGHGFEGELQLPLNLGMTDRFQLISPSGTFNLLTGRPGLARPVVKRRMDAEGFVLLVMEHGFTDIELSDRQFLEHIAQEELQAIAKMRAEQGAKATERERYTRTLKLLIQIGNPGEGLSYRQITDEYLQYIEGMTNLKSLVLHGTQVTDHGLVHLGGLTNLRTLTLSHTQVTDAGLAQLKELASLTTLLLDHTQVTDAGLVHLRGLENLQRLDLGNTRVTDDGVARLQSLKALRLVNLERDEARQRMPAMQLVLGENIEILPLQNPYTLPFGDNLDVLILFDGEPLPDKLVWAYSSNEKKGVSLYKTHTNAWGIARFKLDRKGPWLIRLVHMVPCHRWDDVDWESYWGTFSFKVD